MTYLIRREKKDDIFYDAEGDCFLFTSDQVENDVLYLKCVSDYDPEKYEVRNKSNTLIGVIIYYLGCMRVYITKEFYSRRNEIYFERIDLSKDSLHRFSSDSIREKKLKLASEKIFKHLNSI